jgi:hypothetical protein
MPTRVSILLLMPLICVRVHSNAGADERVDFFEKRIRPILVEQCYPCHSAEGKSIEGGLRVDSPQAMRRGGESGPSLAPVGGDESLLLSAIKYESLEMPPDQKLPEAIVKDFEKWIASGAIDPRDEPVAAVEEFHSEVDYAAGREFWAFQRPSRHALPEHAAGDWCQTDVDHFVAAKLLNAELAPSGRAEPQALLRRLSFDLTGLPPSADQIAHANTLNDVAGYARMVEDLLASPAFGEHWARMWLDLMRFADDQAHIVGNDKSLCFPNSYLYRDWVIQAFNDDVPYDRFVEMQLAADQLTPDNPHDDVALGFMGLGPKYYRRSAPEVMADEWEDRIDVLSQGLLGLTVACARCHDHKYDPIGTADYYALAGIFASVEMFNRPISDDCELGKNGEAKDPANAMHIVRDVEPVNVSIMVRGDVNRRGPEVPRRFLTALCAVEPEPFSQGSGRLELAHHVASSENPLTARVFVNRVWAKLIGRPLVGTPSNFGQLGERPTHPELLDDLAVRFMEQGWSLKWLCRELVSSATYQQSSAAHGQGDLVDPDNQLLWRMHRKRLNVEQWRDAILAATGKLDLSLGGPSIDPELPDSRRRTVYSQASRLKLNPMLALFDYPDPNAHSARRVQTTSPSQKLFLLNSPFMFANANALRERLAKETSKQQQLIERAYQLLYARTPSDDEVAIGLQYLSGSDERMTEYLHALMVTNEVLFVE